LSIRVFFVLPLLLTACSPPQPKRVEGNPDSAAGKAGHAAYAAAQETKKLAREAGRKLDKAGHDAREGWKEAEREKRDKAR
jgi:hypothetical protein